MATALRTHAADADLDDIVAQISQDNLQAATAWLNGIRSLFELLATQPEIGQQIHTRRHGDLRCHVYGNYLVYYRAIRGGVQIVRVLHGARDQRRLI